VKGAVQKNRSQMIESRIASDFCREYMPAYHVWIRPHLGPSYAGQLEAGRSEEEQRALGNWRYFCDAVGVSVKDIVLIEFAIRFRSDHVGKLLGYSYLLPMTPEFAEFHDHELKLAAVSPQFDPLAVLMCERLNIEMVEFKPYYVAEYLDKLELRKRRPTLTLLPGHARYGASFADGYRI
jgi:hypothetical protein